MTEPTELDALMAPLRASFHAKRRDVAAHCEAISRLLDSYLAAVDCSILRELARSHSLPSPAPGADAGRIALDLLARVQGLPELRSLPDSAPDRIATADEKVEGARRREPGKPVRPVAVTPERVSPGSEVPPVETHPWLRKALAQHPLVIVGGPPHLERLSSLSLDTEHTVEWVDTTRQGTHAIGNLERRIRDGRISALLILEGLVQHRHSDPLVSTARVTHVPVAYGGKGGRTALVQSFDEIEMMLRQQK